MKRLILLRHAKAVAKDATRDFDRVLAARGRSDMALMAAVLADPALAPDLALVSPSARTRETWALAELGRVPTRSEPAIYEATSETLLSVARGAPAEARAIVIVGHNPGLSELAWDLTRDGAERARHLSGGLPTSALAVLDFGVEAWPDVAPRSGRLERVATPGSLGGGGRA